METSTKHSNVLELLLSAAMKNPKAIYCKSSKHEFTYEQFVFACIKLANQIKNDNLRNKYIGILLPKNVSTYPFILAFSIIASI